MSKRPLAVDLFSGAGGMSLGFEQAGFDVVAAVDVDPIHCAVHKFNFPKCAVLARSVVGLSAAEIRLAAGLGSKSIDCVFGGPPCQGFSLIGHRALEDPRNGLVSEFVRLVAELNARTFVFENVKGLTVGKHRAFLDELVSAFGKAGYNVRLPWKVLNAANFRVPQSRERLIIFGAKKGLKLPSYPEPMCNVAGARNGISGLPEGPNCHDAISDLPDADKFAVLLESDVVKTGAYGVQSEYAAELRCMTNTAWHNGDLRVWNPSFLTSSSRTEHSEISKSRFSETVQGDVEPISRFFKLSPRGVSNTLRAGTDGARGAFTSPRPIHFKYPRCITVREMARLHGYPDWFRFNATKWHGARQIGNSVPPPLARVVAQSVFSSLNLGRAGLGESICMGDPRLLYFDNSEASKFFGVPALKSRRDRKSGAKKRKQHEIEEAQLVLRALNG